MNIKKAITDGSKIILSLLLGGAILFWMYRDFDFAKVEYVLLNGMDWWWMLLSFPFGILAQVFRGLRWRQTLEPINEYPKSSTSVYSIFISYAVSLVVPRMGEFVRCGILKRYNNISFTKALGTVVTERAIDSLLILLITILTLLSQINIFTTFFNTTGTNIEHFFSRFTVEGYYVTAVCGVAVFILSLVLLKKMSLYGTVKTTLKYLWQGIVSVKSVRNKSLFIFFTLSIWGSYFLHYYLTFFCFESTFNLSLSCALVTFIVGSIAVIVPTPNGAGSWHFAIKTMLILYGVNSDDALNFVLIVHSIQTLLVVVLGIYAWIALSLSKHK